VFPAFQQAFMYEFHCKHLSTLIIQLKQSSTQQKDSLLPVVPENEVAAGNRNQFLVTSRFLSVNFI